MRWIDDRSSVLSQDGVHWADARVRISGRLFRHFLAPRDRNGDPTLRDSCMPLCGRFSRWFYSTSEQLLLSGVIPLFMWMCRTDRVRVMYYFCVRPCDPLGYSFQVDHVHHHLLIWHHLFFVLEYIFLTLVRKRHVSARTWPSYGWSRMCFIVWLSFLLYDQQQLDT